MRREGHIIEEIVEYSNMAESFDQVLSGTKRKKSHQGRYLLAHREEVIKELSERIASGTFHVTAKDIEEKDIIEAGKLRHIQFFKKLKNSIAVHAIMSVVDKHLKKRFIRTTSASIKNRGMHDLMKYIRRDIQKDPEGTRFCYKFDISKFYESVNQDFVMYSVHRVFKDKKLIAMLDNFVRIIPQGISIGLRSSQGLGNLLLSVYLDHYLKDRYGVRHFYRDCDDGVVLGKTKAELWEIRDRSCRISSPYGSESCRALRWPEGFVFVTVLLLRCCCAGRRGGCGRCRPARCLRCPAGYRLAQQARPSF